MKIGQGLTDGESYPRAGFACLRNRPGQRRLSFMTEQLPALVENSLEVAWQYLEGLGEISDPQKSAEFLIRSIQKQIQKGETRPLMLSNKAIEAHQRPALIP
jgi:hypothetical protein